MEKVVVPILEYLVSIMTSDPITFFNIFIPGDLCHWFDFTVNTSQKHNKFVSLGMPLGL